MMDLSKAFDNINRNDLIKDLSKMLEQNELNLLRILLNVELSVKCIHTVGEGYITDTGAPQGNCLSPIEFTYYLPKTLALHHHERSNTDRNYENKEEEPPRNKSYHEHSYTKVKNQNFPLEIQYADGISKIPSNTAETEQTKKVYRKF